MPRRSLINRVAVGRAPGKIILLGEHAVVYGEPAIGAPLSHGVEVSIAPGRGELELITPPSFGVLAEQVRAPRGSLRAAPPASTVATPESLVRAALGSLADEVDLTIRFEVPPMSGLGSSAALAVALLRARNAALSRDRQVTLAEAIAIENVAHGRSSGVDPAIALASSPIVFKKRRTRALKIGAPLFLIAGARGGHGGTGRSVGRIATMKDRSPRLIGAAIRTLGEASVAGERAIARGALDALGEAMELAHGVLSGLALVSPAVEEVVRAAKEAGAIAAKMSGAGGQGGAFVALAKSAKIAARVRDRVEALGALAWIERFS